MVREAEFVAWMVLRETAIFVCVWSAARAGPQVRDQFFQLNAAPSHFNPNKYFSFGRSHQQIKALGVGMMLGTTRFQKDVPWQPSSFENQPGRRRELANIFAQQSWRFRREEPVGSEIGGGGVRAQQIAFDFAPLVHSKQILSQATREKICFPLRERRRDSEAGERRYSAERVAHLRELSLQPRFQIGVHVLMQPTRKISCCRSRVVGVYFRRTTKL